MLYVLYKIITCSSITWICRKHKVVLISLDFGSLKVTTFADMEGEETFDSSLLGHADEVIEERIADDDVILIKGTKNSSAVSGFFLPIFKTSSMFPVILVVAGGGAVEAALYVYLEYLATTLGSREQLAIAEFAESFLVIPKVVNNIKL
ncbi:hypothetical protein BHE74_00044375 [Ensete ventricosum]|nr:hypothetical protein BHE74_00044375 [Ensete ventricosum]